MNSDQDISQTTQDKRTYVVTLAQMRDGHHEKFTLEANYPQLNQGDLTFFDSNEGLVAAFAQGEWLYFGRKLLDGEGISDIK